MSSGADLIRQGVESLETELIDKPREASDQMIALGSPCSQEYADAALGINGFGGNTAEIYFYRFAPKCFPSPGDENYSVYMADAGRAAEYASICFNGFLEELSKVERIVSSYNGVLTIDHAPRELYVQRVKMVGKESVHRAHVTLSFVDQRKMWVRGIKALLEQITEYETNEKSV